MKRKNAMKHWKNGPILNWKAQPKAEFLSFKANGPRRIKFEVMSVGKCEVWATHDGGQSETLVAVGENEKFYVETVIDKDIDMLIKTENKCTAYVNVPDLDQSVEKRYADENFTNLEPRVAANPDLVRMQNMFKSTVEMMKQQIAQQKAIIESNNNNKPQEDVIEASQEVTQEEGATNDTEGDSAAS
jgi:hypothetical protein